VLKIFLVFISKLFDGVDKSKIINFSSNINLIIFVIKLA